MGGRCVYSFTVFWAALTVCDLLSWHHYRKRWPLCLNTKPPCPWLSLAAKRLIWVPKECDSQMAECCFFKTLEWCSHSLIQWGRGGGGVLYHGLWRIPWGNRDSGGLPLQNPAWHWSATGPWWSAFLLTCDSFHHRLLCQGGPVNPVGMTGCSDEKTVALKDARPRFKSCLQYSSAAKLRTSPWVSFYNGLFHGYDSHDNNNICLAELFGGLNTIQCI